MGRLLRNVLLDFAQFEREMTADRTRDKMHQRAQKGLWNGGNVPYGYTVENKRLVIQMTTKQPAFNSCFTALRIAPSLATSARRICIDVVGTPDRNKPWSKTALDSDSAKSDLFRRHVRFNEERL